MKYFLENAPKIIEQAAKSSLGILALMVLVLALLALVFFKNAPVKVRIGIFIMLFLGVAGFATTVARHSAESEKDALAKAGAEKKPTDTHQTNLDLISQLTLDGVSISDEARQNLEWIFNDNGAAKTYQAARNAGNSRYDAALAAQSGPKQQGAYRSIVACGRENVEKYLEHEKRP